MSTNPSMNRTGLSPGVLAWGKTLAIIGGGLALYVGVTLIAAIFSGSPIMGAAVGNLAIFFAAIIYRWKRAHTAPVKPPLDIVFTPLLWTTALLGLATCWLAGQTAAQWVYTEFGDPQYEAIAKMEIDSPIKLLLLTGLFLAPMGEEALLRGLAYPALRRHWPPLAAAFVTAAVFALLHGNLVQIVLTLPLGLLLAFVYELTQRLWPVIIMHVMFNITAAIVPLAAIQKIAHPPVIIATTIATVLVLISLNKHRNPEPENNNTADLAK